LGYHIVDAAVLAIVVLLLLLQSGRWWGPSWPDENRNGCRSVGVVTGGSSRISWIFMCSQRLQHV